MISLICSVLLSGSSAEAFSKILTYRIRLLKILIMEFKGGKKWEKAEKGFFALFRFRIFFSFGFEFHI